MDTCSKFLSRKRAAGTAQRKEVQEIVTDHPNRSPSISLWDILLSLSEVVKATVKGHPNKVLEILNHLLLIGNFPQEWKDARLVLIEKIKPGQNNMEYKFICLLNILGQLLERLILEKLSTRAIDDTCTVKSLEACRWSQWKNWQKKMNSDNSRYPECI